MTKHVMSMTYPPKIEPVQDGRCTQTIRKGDKVAVDDQILFHGWAGKPYRSKWNWRKRVVVNEVIPILISEDGIDVFSIPGHPLPWQNIMVCRIAFDDYINPPTGEALRDVLFGLNDIPTEPKEYQIIRWIV